MSDKTEIGIMPPSQLFGLGAGWGDAKKAKELKEKVKNKDSVTYPVDNRDLGEVELRNSMLPRSSFHYEISHPLFNPELTLPQQAEIADSMSEVYSQMTTLIRPLTKWQLKAFYMPQTMTLLEKAPLYNDANHDGSRQDGEQYIYNGKSGRPVFGDIFRTRNTTQLGGSITAPPWPIFGSPWTLMLGGEWNETDYYGQEDIYFTLDGKSHPLLLAKGVRELKVDAAVGIPVMPLVGDTLSPLPYMLLNKLELRYGGLLTRQGLTSFTGWGSDRANGNIAASRVESKEFSSFLNTGEVTATTQTVPFLLDKAYSAFTRAFATLRGDLLTNRNMPNIYFLNEDNFVGPWYPYTADEQHTIEDDRQGVTSRMRDDLKKRMGSWGYNWGLISDMPGLFQIGRGLGFVGKAFDDYSDEKLQIKWTVGETLNDTLSAFNNGRTPRYYSCPSSWYKPPVPLLDQNGNPVFDTNGQQIYRSDESGKGIYDPMIHQSTNWFEEIGGRHSYSWSIGGSYLLRVGHLGKFISPWDYGNIWEWECWSEYFSKENVGYGEGLIPRIPMAFAGLFMPLIRPVVGFVDKGRGPEKDVPIYIPLEISYGETSYWERDPNTQMSQKIKGYSAMFGGGIGIGKNLTVRGRYFNTSEGIVGSNGVETYRNHGWTLSLDIKLPINIKDLNQ